MATTESMNIHKGLIELKILEDRIEKAIYAGDYCTWKKNATTQIKGVSIADYEDTVKNSYTSVKDLIKRRNAIKQAIVLSNACTKVQIGEKEYTVAEAIEMKNHGIEFQQQLLSAMKTNLANVQNKIVSNNSSLDEKADRFVTSMLGTKEKVNVSEFEKARQDYITANELLLVDPLNLEKEIKDLETKIDTFLSEVDSTLSTSNALTIINVAY